MCVEFEPHPEGREHVETRYFDGDPSQRLCLVKHYVHDAANDAVDKSRVAGWSVEHASWTEYGMDTSFEWFLDGADARGAFAEEVHAGAGVWRTKRGLARSDARDDWRRDAAAYLGREIAKDLRAHGARVVEW